MKVKIVESLKAEESRKGRGWWPVYKGKKAEAQGLRGKVYDHVLGKNVSRTNMNVHMSKMGHG